MPLFDPSAVLDAYALSHSLTGSACNALETFLAYLAHDEDIIRIDWAAYILATVRHETWNTFRPLSENGMGKGKPYGTVKIVVDSGGVSHSNRYYGRGFVQLTWLENYTRVSQLLGLGESLAVNPEKVLDPPIAYRILAAGMTKGWFTGKRLDQYLNPNKKDYVGCRRIINGLDRSDLIAGYALEFEGLLHDAATPAQTSAAKTSAAIPTALPPVEIAK